MFNGLNDMKFFLVSRQKEVCWGASFALFFLRLRGSKEFAGANTVVCRGACGSMVCPARVERATFGSASQRSIHLSYGHMCN